jgi:membrane-associated phospholipid phosphatase
MPSGRQIGIDHDRLPGMTALSEARLKMLSRAAQTGLMVTAALVSSTRPAMGQRPRLATSVPQLHWETDGGLGAAGVVGITIGLALPVTRRPVPEQGLDPSAIGWRIDRDIIGPPSTSADQASDIFLLATLLAPPAFALATQPGVHGLGQLVRRPVVLYGQALLLAEACVQLLKPVADRARPFTYLPAAERPSGSSYDARARDAFVSMPSGHSALAFAAAGYAATDDLLARPEASAGEHLAVATIGAMLAGFTGNLRIQAKEHFPSDALVGSLIGTAGGVSVPMVHRYVLPDGRRGPHPGGHAWLMSAAGYVMGTAIGVGLSSVVY